VFGPDHFNDDRDAYLVLAQGLADGRGFSVPGTSTPTAYRPPLYPILLSPVCSTTPQGKVGRAAIHLFLAVGMVWFLWDTARTLGISTWGRCLAAGLVTCDPLLVLYANFPMTETLCAFLGAWLIRRCVSLCTGWQCDLLTGLVFGLCVLSRPTFWIAGVLLVIATWITNCRPSENRSRCLQAGAWTGVGVLLCVVPWAVRNWIQLGHPVLMTTHGGYTLLLGNNQDFYDQVTSRSWSTVWEGAGQQDWADRLNRTLDEAEIWSEVERDARMSAEAKATIRARPDLFLKATVSRVVQFWNVLPGGESARQFPQSLVWGCVLFYLGFWGLALVGLWRILAERRQNWLAVLILPLAFTMVHAVYWSNIRMRAPVVPAIALVAALGIEKRRSSWTG
jgi:hypothetical protein